LKRCKQFLIPVVVLVALVTIAGCKKKAPLPPPAAVAPPVAAPAAPTAEITATPMVVTAGDRVVLSWHTNDAVSAHIDGIGDVPMSGTRTITPSASTSFRLEAKGPGGTATASVRVTVNPAPVVAPPPVSTMSMEEMFKTNVQDVFFDYDKYTLRSDAQAALTADSSYLLSHPEVKILIGGYCDERGSNDYNLALGQNRADAAKKALESAGVAASRIRTVSYGKEKPFCMESTEACWQKNRRAGFTLDK